jgi:hypothetical protein
MLLALVVYFVKKDKAWCTENMNIGDFLAVFNAFLQVCDPKRIMHFFVKINQQVPVVALLATPKGMKV